MSVAEHPPDDTGTGFERTPPHDIMAEQSVLGGMLLSKEAITQVVEIVRSADFYRPAHQTVFDVTVDLFSRGEPVDAISVNAELTKRGEIARVGGAPYLHTLTEAIPTAANAGYYARIVSDRAVLRRLVEVGTRIAQIGYSGDGEVDDLVDHAQAEIHRVAEKRTGEDYLPLSDIMPGALDEIEAISAHDGSMTGVPTGFTDFDQLSNGLHPGQMIIIAARPAVGKALALDTPLPTPRGWTTMGDVAVGDHLVAADGTPTRVIAATEVMRGRPCYELEFADGTVVVADAQHQWPTLGHASGASVHGLATTGELAAALEYAPADVEPAGIAISAPRARESVASPGGGLATGTGAPGATALLDPQPVDNVSASSSRRHRLVAARRVDSVPVRCVQVAHPDHLYLATRARIPTHNSTLALDFARAASIKNQLTSVFFSLEMGRNEIVMRLLSAEARVPLHTMRSGLMTDDDWARLARRMGEVASAPLFIDDSPNLSMMEIRAKCRRLKQQHDLKLIVVDYLQLMSSAGRVESRQQEVSEMSRSLKLLAKELDVPVVALSQLNRGPEQRTDKKPQVSDLRESGCLTADTRILRADTGAETTIGALYAAGARDVSVWSLDETLRFVPQTMTRVFHSGTKPTFRLRMTSGREVTASGNHPFLTYDGWKRLDQLTPGDRLSVPRHVPEPERVCAWPDEEVVLLAHLIGDGSFVWRRPVRYASMDEENLRAVTRAAAHFGVTPVRDEYVSAGVTTLRLPAPYRLSRGMRNPVAQWLEGLGLFGLRSHEKFVPEGVWSLPREQVALFLHHLWATEGCVRWDEKAGQARPHYSSTSRRLVDDVSRLLLRFGIMTRIRTVTKAGYRPGYHLVVDGADSQRRFLEEIGVYGERGKQARLCLERLSGTQADTNLDTVPEQVWDRVRTALSERETALREYAPQTKTQSRGSALTKTAPSRPRLRRVATVLGDAELEMLATNDVFWDEIAEIEPLGEQEVFDATVAGTHNFVADGINVHNSIEQDADMVVLLYREDAHDKESPRAGEADIIVAKHRNGPTATVTVAFQGHYSRFVDMAPG